MKKYIVYLLLSAVCIFSSCGDDGMVSIVSLNTFGNKVCRNDIVKVFVSAETSGTDLPTYEWGCNGGTLTNPPGLFENVWKAPNEPGEYEIWVNVERNGAKDTRKAKIIVLDELLYSDFETPYFNEGYSLSNMKFTQDKNTASALVTASKDSARFQKNWSADMEVVPPYSMQMRYIPKTIKSVDDFIDFRVTFMSQENVSQKLNTVDFIVYPLSGAYKVLCNYFDMNTGTNNNIVAEEGCNDIFKSVNDWRYISVSIDDSKQFVVYYEGTKFLQSHILSSFSQPLQIQGSGLMLRSNKSEILIDDLTVLDNGEICTAAERVR